MRVTVVTPTYNEAKNIVALVERVFQVLAGHEADLIVVDDNSPDGTADQIRQLAGQYPIKLISRPTKAGLGTAYVAGFNAALMRPAVPETIVQLDADLSHAPEDIPRLLAEVGSHDLVIGSRYARGGKIEKWNWPRRLISRLANTFVRAVLGIPVADVTGGFKCWRGDFLRSLDLNNISSIGYNFQIEMTYRAFQRQARLKEVPITFTERTAGRSKFDLGIML